jgi:hypothetical protein
VVLLVSKREVSVLVKPTAAADVTTSKALDDLRRQVEGRSFADGARLLTAVDIVDGVNRIPHGLGRRPKGWLVVGRRNVLVTERRFVAAHAAQERNAAEVTEPDGGTDYWAATATTRVAYPMPVHSGEVVVEAGVNFYHGGASSPVFRLMSGTTAASAATITPTVAWTSPGAATTWVPVYASFEHDLGTTEVPSLYIDVTAGNTDRIRAAYIDVQRDFDPPELIDEHDIHTDTDTFLYLVSAGMTATVDLLVF